jgi:Tol biopolymer transport system component
MKGIPRALFVCSLLASVHCRDASAPAADPDANQPGENPPVGQGSRIAFVTEVTPGAGGFVYVANADGSGVRRLPGAQAYYSKPSWSPDGRRIVVGRFVPSSSSSSVVVIDVDGQGGGVALANGSHPAWSPDGSKIAFSAGGSDVSIHVMDADGRNVKRLTSPNDPSQCTQGSSASDWKSNWSPDGRKIVFERDLHTDDGGYDCGLDGWGYIPYVWLMNADGSGLRRLRSAPSSQSDSDPTWSPDGRFIAYYAPHDGLYLIDSEGAGAPRRLALQNLDAGTAMMPAWSPDGKKLLFLIAAPPNNKLAIVDIESGTTNVLNFPTVAGLLLDPAWSR